MKKYCLFILLTISFLSVQCQNFEFVDIDSEVTAVQPMTGIVFWPGNSKINTDAISLEYSYMDYDDIVTGEDQYDWTVVDNLLDKMAERNHQAVLRFRFSYPGKTTTVPQYIKDLADYEETEGQSEGKTTWFPDWTHPELQDFTLKFYEEYASRYDNDPRLAFVQVGFGLWAEYHIYSGPFTLGETFPSKDFQKAFFTKLNDVFQNTYWSISIDAASGTYSPFEDSPEYLDYNFGLFDDSFMHSGHAGYNENSWNFFDRDRYQLAPAGGEFSYYSDYDQENVLNEDVGPYGVPYEIFAQNFHISYINGNDQGGYQTLDRIKEASLASGYKFKLNSFQTKPDSSIIEVINVGVAPIYIDAYLAVNGIRSEETLKLLLPDSTRTFHISTGGTDAIVTIESDDILDTEEIQYFGTVNEYEKYVLAVDDLPTSAANNFNIYPTASVDGLYEIEHVKAEPFSVTVLDFNGKALTVQDSDSTLSLDLGAYAKGTYILLLTDQNNQRYTSKIIRQ